MKQITIEVYKRDSGDWVARTDSSSHLPWTNGNIGGHESGLTKEKAVKNLQDSLLEHSKDKNLSLFVKELEV